MPLGRAGASSRTWSRRGLHRRGVALPERAPRSLDGVALGEEIDEVILDGDELLLPEQGHQIVARVGREEAGAVHRLEEADQLILLGALLDGEHPHPILEQRPRERLALVDLLIDDLLLPEDLGLRDREHELVAGGPDRAERAPHVLDGALVDRVVGEIHLKGAERLDHRLQQLRDLARDEERRRGHACRHGALPSSAATCATSLSPASAEADQHRRYRRPTGRGSPAPTRRRAPSRAPG